MKLTELEPSLYRYETRNSVEQWKVPVKSLSDAQCIMFLCPKCFVDNNGKVGTHQVEVTFEGRGATPEQGSHNKAGKPTRWNVSGNGFNDLTLAPSILNEGGCAWHGFITNGQVH